MTTAVETQLKNLDKGDHTLRNQIIAEYLPYVNRIVNRIATHLPPTVEIDDLVNVGIIGLIQAIERYDPSRDNKFMTYAVFRIKGAVLSELRSRDFLGRTTRKKIRSLEKAYLKLEQKLGREAKDEEVARELDMNLDQFYQVKRMSSISFVSFEEIGYATKEGKENFISQLLSPGDSHDALSMTTVKEIKNALAEHIEKLPEKEKLVVSMYYSDEMTMKEIGKVLDITESRVSQIHSQAVIRLRAKLRKDGLIEQ
ncbi:MAG: FliA/WhiG family RNA polymerase sigma factor [Desulfobacteraceae bacterium]|nr:FliA/WhiG family RNA polymerase sigma factor [Desulfobacteraceae bacterium]